MKLESKEIFGAEIQYFRMEPEYWEKTISAFKQAGLRCVTSYVPWSTHLVGPPDADNPAGVLDFEGKTDGKRNLLGFIELIEKYGLNMNFRCGPFCCNEMVHGGYPDWLVLGDPQMMVWDYQNRTTEGYWIGKKEGSQPSYLHPEYLEWCEKWINEVDKIIVPHLKVNGGCITMINLDNEVSYIVQDGFLTSDYNPINVGRGGYYHQFLRSKYGEQLPYEQAYNCIEDVLPPRNVPDSIERDLTYYLDWSQFKLWTMCEYISRLRQMHEKNGVKDVIFMTNFNPHLPEGIPTRMPAFEQATDGIVGYDFYRGKFMSYSGYQSMARILKLMNASLKYTWSAEFMAGTWNKDLTDLGRVSEEHTRFMTRCALAHGCKSIAWFMFHDRDCWGDGPLSSHGHIRTNYRVLKETPSILFNKIKDWDGLKPKFETVIIYDVLQLWHTFIGDASPSNDNNLHIGKPLIGGVQAGLATNEYIGLFRLVEQAGYQAGVADISHSTYTLNSVPIAFLPGSPVIEMDMARKLHEYVENGGVLVVTGPFPFLDEKGDTIGFLGIENHFDIGNETKIGKGRLIWHKEFIANEPSEKDNLLSIAFVKKLLDDHTDGANVRIEPCGEVSWVDWHPDGGHARYVQSRNLGSAILHEGKDEKILFVLNHYPEAANFHLCFKDKNVSKLINLSDDTETVVTRDGAFVDIDRKSAEIYAVQFYSD